MVNYTPVLDKSTLARLFCEKYKLDLIEINLEKIKLKSTQKEDFDLNSTLDEIQIRAKKNVTQQSLLFFDEIQDDPVLLSRLRYFYEERPDIAVIAAGSLLELTIHSKNFSFPVGRVQFYHLGPMTFTEKKMIELLVDAKILVKCHHTNANAIPLAAETDLNIFKLYFLDIGLINALMNLDLDIIDQEFKNHFATKGFLAEQFVSQHLAYIYGHQKTPELFYWLRDKDTQKGEIDFLIQVKNKIFPIEVKSSHGTHLKSLLYFSQEKESETGFKISLAKFSKETIQFKIKDKSVKLNLINVPLFAIEHLLKTLEEP